MAAPYVGVTNCWWNEIQLGIESKVAKQVEQTEYGLNRYHGNVGRHDRSVSYHRMQTQNLDDILIVLPMFRFVYLPNSGAHTSSQSLMVISLLPLYVSIWMFFTCLTGFIILLIFLVFTQTGFQLTTSGFKKIGPTIKRITLDNFFISA